MDLKSVPSEELIAELNSRDLFNELPDETAETMKRLGFSQITNFPFFNKYTPNPVFVDYHWARQVGLSTLNRELSGEFISLYNLGEHIETKDFSICRYYYLDRKTGGFQFLKEIGTKEKDGTLALERTKVYGG